VAALGTTALTVTGAVTLGRYPRLVARVLLASGRWPLLSRFGPRIRQSARDYYRSAMAFKEATVSTRVALNAFTISQWFGSFMFLWAVLGLCDVETNPLTILAIGADVEGDRPGARPYRGRISQILHATLARLMYSLDEEGMVTRRAACDR
jgi:hypothetical protein